VLSILTLIFKSLTLFSGSYSNNVFKSPLSKEEEDKQIKLLLEGNKDARNTLIEHNLRLVAHIVKKYNKSYDNDDLISIGTIGLIKGIDSFSNEKNTKLTTYCARCIDNEILMHFRNEKKNMNNVSLEEKIGYDKDGNEIELLDMLEDKSINILKSYEDKVMHKNLYEALKTLNSREYEIISRRYGINRKSQTQKEISKDLNISRSYVSRIEKRALLKLYLLLKK